MSGTITTVTSSRFFTNSKSQPSCTTTAAAPAESLVQEKTALVVEKADGEKCERCWTISETVGTSEKHPTLCKRCAEVVENYYA